MTHPPSSLPPSSFDPTSPAPVHSGTGHRVFLKLEAKDLDVVGH